MKEFYEELKKLKGKGLLRKLVCLESSNEAKILINGQRYINFSSNDYLGLSNHPKILAGFMASIRRYGFGSGASRLLSGSCIPHKRLEERLAKFKKTEAALLFNSGYSANTGIIPALAGAEGTIFSDELNHASIIDGARISKAKIKIYRHREVGHLEELLRGSSGKMLVITDSVFSMNGDIAPLRDIAALCRKYNAMVMIDDAHGTGVLGRTGRGALEHADLHAGEIIQMGTLSKAFGCMGGFVAGSRELIEFLINRARSFMYSTSLPPAVAEACIRAIDIVDTRSQKLRKKLWKNRHLLCDGLNDLGYETLNSETPIIPVFVGDVKETAHMGCYLYKHKIYAPAIRPPTVREGRCRVRFSVTALHAEEDINLVLETLEKYKAKK